MAQLGRVAIIAGLGLAPLVAAQFPQARISSGSIEATVYLPDARQGYYRGTRFDWSGVFASLQYRNHNYFGPWFQSFDPKVRDFVYEGPGDLVKAGACSAISGPVEEFSTGAAALGYEQAKPGETFVKIGVGVLRKPDDAAYDKFRLYDIVDPGKWTVRTGRDRVEFTQELNGPFGYAYVYRKTVRLAPNQPELVIEHSLKNTGTREIRTSVYDHNFLVIDNQPPGPDFSISFPFKIESGQDPASALGETRGNAIVYRATLAKQDRFATAIRGFSNDPKDYDIRVENRKTGAGVRIRGDRPLSRLAFWSIRTVLSPEPFIDLTAAPGQESTWKYTYTFYTVPTAPAH